MRLICPHCGDAAEIPDDRLPPRGTRGACRTCGATAFFDGVALVRLEGGNDDTPPRPLEPEMPAASSEDDTPARPLEAVGPEATAAAAAAAGAGPAVWHVNTPSGQSGPLPLSGIKGLIRSGELTEVDHVYGPGQGEGEGEGEGEGDWMLAGDREELKRYFATKAKATAAAAAASLAAGGAVGGAAAGARSGAPVRELDLLGPCTQHPAVEAEWTCKSCVFAWCPSCAVVKKLPGGDVSTCPKCERPLMRRTKARRIVPWWTELGEVFLFPVRGFAWLAIVVLCGVWLMQLLASGAGPLGMLTRLILSFGVLSWFVLLIRHVGSGRRDMPDLGRVESYRRELLFPGVKALVVSLLAFLPLFIYGFFVAQPALAEFAVAKELAAQLEEAPPASSLGEGGDLELDPQREALIEAMRRMGSSEEEIDRVLAEFDAEAGGEAGGEREARERFEPRAPKPPSGLGVFLKLLGVPALLVYSVAIWPILMIILALFNTIVPAFNPPLILRIVKDVWPAYSKLLLFLAPFMLVELVLDLVTAPDLVTAANMAALGIPSALRLLLVPVLFYVQLVMMYAIGRTAEIIDAEIDWV